MDVFKPLWLFGDGAEYQERDSIATVCFGGVCTEGVTLDTAIYIISWPERCAAKFRQGHAQDTWHRIYTRVVYCFKTLFFGKYLDVDEFDQPWPAGSDEAARAGQWLTPNEDRFVVWNLEGDRKHNSDDLGLAHHASDTKQ